MNQPSMWSLADPAVVVSDTDIHELDRIFRLQPDLRSIVVDNGDDGLGIVDRVRLELRLNGRLGFGRALHAFHPPSTPVQVPAAVVVAEATPDTVSQVIAARPKAHRLDDLVVRSHHGKLATVAVADIFAALASHYEDLACTDALTGLANRRRLMTTLTDALDTASAGEIAFALFDVDRFKRINDRFGHPAGDAVLVETARRLAQWSPPGSVPGRIGGDEFAVVFPSMHTDLIETSMVRLQNALRRPVTYDGETIHVDTSAGYATTRTIGATDVDLLQRQADRALYKAKSAGGARYVADLPTRSADHQSDNEAGAADNDRYAVPVALWDRREWARLSITR